MRSEPDNSQRHRPQAHGVAGVSRLSAVCCQAWFRAGRELRWSSASPGSQKALQIFLSREKPYFPIYDWSHSRRDFSAHNEKHPSPVASCLLCCASESRIVPRSPLLPPCQICDCKLFPVTWTLAYSLRTSTGAGLRVKKDGHERRILPSCPKLACYKVGS